MKIVTIVGARPQFIKAAALNRLTRRDDRITEVIVHTGQHYDDSMSDVFFRELEIDKPDRNLAIRASSHGAMTGRQLIGIEAILLEEKPDAVLVYGDTNSTLAGALAAVKLQIPIAHVEAGLRSFNKRMPEEINRVLTDHVSTLLFAPTQTAVDNLLREGVAQDKIILAGDIMYDVALYFGVKAKTASKMLDALGLKYGTYALTTIHRAESTNDRARLKVIMDSLVNLSLEMPVVFPIHPRTRAVLSEMALLEEIERSIMLVEPVGYLDMTSLVQNARLVITDSGGLQKEAYFHNVQAVTLRDETEWTELITLGVNRLPDSLTPDAISRSIRQALAAPAIPATSLYGNGKSAEIIADALIKKFSLS